MVPERGRKAASRESVNPGSTAGPNDAAGDLLMAIAAATNDERVDVLLISTAASIGGMERAICGLARELEARGRTIVTIFPDSPDNGALLRWCREQGVDALSSPAVRDAADHHRLYDMVALRRLVRQFRPAVVSLHYGDTFASAKDVLAVRLAGAPRCVVSIHQARPRTETSRRKWLATRLAALLASDVTAFSTATQDLLIEAGVSARNVALIPHGIRPPARMPGKAAARQALGICETARVVGVAARLVPHKGVADLVEAVGRLDDPKVHLAIAGEGPEHDALACLASRRLGDRARFLGHVADMATFYAACDVFSLPSYMEGFGLVYVEAAFHGVPSVGTKVGGVPDAVADGETGILVPPGDVDALTEAVGRLLADEPLRLRMGEAARRRALAEFSECRMVDGFERLFRLPGATRRLPV